MALDCKINFDDNAMFRHKDLKECAIWRRKTRWRCRHPSST